MFCYECGQQILKYQGKSISEKECQPYFLYFGRIVVDSATIGTSG